jgi:hypothetical protein
VVGLVVMVVLVAVMGVTAAASTARSAAAVQVPYQRLQPQQHLMGAGLRLTSALLVRSNEE